MFGRMAGVLAASEKAGILSIFLCQTDRSLFFERTFSVDANNQKKHDHVRTLLCEASNIFLQQLEVQTSINPEFVSGLEKLLYATELTKHWDQDSPICPSCGCVYCRLVAGDHLQCLSCDHEWNNDVVVTTI